MVVGEPTDDAVDDVFHALADATRRDILRRCAADELSVSRLADGYPMSFAAVQKHVAVLERAGLVTRRATAASSGSRPTRRAVSRARHALDQLEADVARAGRRMADLLGTPARHDREEQDR